IFATLFEAEAEQPLSFIPEAPGFDGHSETGALTKQKYASALSYVLRRTFTPKRIAMLATAATLLIGVVITIVVLTGPEGTDSTAIVPDTSLPSEAFPAATQRIVATLTAEHNAVWDRRPGQDLYAAQRFTLEEGVAEITTTSGAVAILEGPAKIELINENAIRLSSGRLVGMVNTPSAKGFLVTTPHMDVTDLGTEFGVAVGTDSIEVSVFEGAVEIRGPRLKSQLLTVSQRARLSVYGNEQDLVIDGNILQDHVRVMPGTPLVVGADYTSLGFKINSP
ncbi:MAG: FecR family protein, partial [Cyanobacteria bacterium P01_C01_bin.38]